MMMKKNEMITPMQLAFILYPTVMATGFLALPSLAASYAPYDFWMIGLVVLGTGILSVAAATSLHARFPRMTVVECSERILGKALGKIIGMLYFLNLVHVTGVVSREYAEFVKNNFLIKTPMMLVIVLMLLLVSNAVRGGVSVIAKSALIFTTCFVFPLIFLLLLLPDLEWGNVLPFMSHGIVPVLKASAVPQSWVSELFLINFFLPYVSDSKAGMKWGYIALSAVSVSMVLINLIVLLVLGLDTSNKAYPILVAFRYISIGGFFENLEALLLVMWVAGNFVKLTVFLYATVTAFSQCFGVTDFRTVVLPIAVLASVFSIWDLPNFSVMQQLLVKVGTFETPLFMNVIPLLLLLVAWLTGRKSADDGGVGG
ncbi:endospore germination permease [Paenibacillus sp. PR3]|uniref:Endospore germination permease n=1 Tax=Paenibacillus terricola TaxID=2763503 RepID=A0ABR8MXZ3_9BACL|nr:endospore germination permease [Paenibacillus terricola]MBD3919800.1 endospore germination permease [Paenibacillus terricola]